MLGMEGVRISQKTVVFVKQKWRVRTSNSEEQETEAQTGFRGSRSNLGTKGGYAIFLASH